MNFMGWLGGFPPDNVAASLSVAISNLLCYILSHTAFHMRNMLFNTSRRQMSPLLHITLKSDDRMLES